MRDGDGAGPGEPVSAGPDRAGGENRVPSRVAGVTQTCPQ